MRLATSLVILCAAASTAGADATSRFEIVDRGDAVEVIAHDVKAAKTTISPIRSRLEVPLVGTHTIPKLVPPTDKTVKVIELDGHSQQVLSVKLDFERPQVQQLAKHAQAIQVGNDLHILVPRAIPAAGTTVALPEPTLTPELAAKAAAIAPVIDVKPEAKPEPKLDVKPVAATTEVKPAEVPATGPLIRKTEPAETPKKQEPIGKASEGGMKNFPMLLACVLALLGCIVWVKRRKSGANAAKPSTSIEIIAQKSLGKQAKIVWLVAGGREMIVSVTAQQVRMLGQWKKSESPSAVRTPIRAEGSGRISTQPVTERARRSGQFSIPEATALPSLASDKSDERRARSSAEGDTKVNDKAASPAVAGILKLRARTNVPMVNEDVATDDVNADEVWAREILAATGARR